MTRNEPISKGRTTLHGQGVGTVTPEMLEQRAHEIALINGRSQQQVNAADYDQARHELLGDNVSTPLLENGEEAAETAPWDPAPGSLGTKPEGQEVDDEQSMADRLVHEGVEEAQHDQMVKGTRDSIRRDMGER